MRSRAPHLRLLLVLVMGLVACRPDAQVTGAANDEATHRELTVAAAASLRRVMPELGAAWSRRHPTELLTFSYGGSGDLRRQVEAGAPIDAVVLAHPEPVETLVQRGLVRAEWRREVASNSLVLVGRIGAQAGAGTVLTFDTLGALPEGAFLALGEPRTVPAGQYAHLLLESLGLWDALTPRRVFASDVSAVLTYVRRGEAEVGIVYRTDLIGLDDVEVLDTAAGPDAPDVRYVAAPIEARAQAFVDFVARDAEARAIWARHGFAAP